MTTMNEFMELCKKYEEVWIIEGNTLLLWKDHRVKVVHFDKREVPKCQK